MNKKKIKVQGLVASYNRMNTTISSLDSLMKSKISNKIDLKILLVDDNSTDKTNEMVSKNFPFINIIKSRGELYWAGAMKLGWTAIKNKNFDYLLLFNDDTFFFEDSLNTLVNLAEKNQNTIIAGSISSCKEPYKIIYGGVKKKSIHPLKFKGSENSNGIKDPDTCNMNATLVPIEIIRDIGFLDKHFTHSKADFEFGLRAKKNNYNIISTYNPIGCTELNEKKNENYYYENSLYKTLKGLNHPKKIPYKERYYYFKTYGGFFWMILFLKPYFKIITLFFLRKYLFFKK